MITALGLRFPAILLDDHVIALDRKARISVPIIRIIEAAGPGVLEDQGNQGIGFAIGHRESHHLAIALVETKGDMLASCAPAAFTLVMAAIHALIHFNFTIEDDLSELLRIQWS